MLKLESKIVGIRLVLDGIVEKMTVIGHVSDLRKKLISMVILDPRG